MPTLTDLGWDDNRAEEFAPHAASAFVPGRVAVPHRGAYDVLTETGELRCDVAGRLYDEADSPAVLPAVGDWVVVAPRPDESAGTIQAVLERRTKFSRKTAWQATEEQGLKLAVYCTGPAIRNVGANLVTEFIGTFALVFGVYAIFTVGGTAGDLSAGLGPLLVGFLVWGIGLSLGGPTGYAINPARDLSPRIAHAVLPIAGKGSSDWEYSWIPVVGPIAGGIVGALAGSAVFTNL